MKRLFAILFGALLVLTQSDFASGTPAGPAVTNCGCEKHTCCAGKSAPDHKPLPATPARPLSLKQWQVVLPPVVPILASAALPATDISSTHISYHRLDATPLYQRNCTRLI